MAKRKRKMTLFDVINTGQAKGLQVRHRVPTYQPTPELPVQKKLAKLFGRRKSSEHDRPLTAAEELEQLRRELAPTPEPEPKPVPRTTTRVVDYQPEEEDAFQAPRAPAMSVGDRARLLAAEAAGGEPPAREPGKPIGQRFSEAWAFVSPKLASAGRSMGRGTSNALIGLRTQVSLLGELPSRYAVTAVTAVGAIALVGGAYLVGSTLLNRPAVNIDFNNAIAVRPDVLDLNTRNNDAVANVGERRTETTLVNKGTTAPPTPAPAVANTAVFGGRDLSMNYVIIQSCATQIDADATVEMLAKQNIGASVELGLGFNRTLPYAVVSRTGFARMGGNTEFTNFISNLNRISEVEAGKSIRDRLDPQPFKFRPRT